MANLSRLPSRFPVGTKFVIEGRPGKAGKPQTYSRHLEFPDGTLVRLPARRALASAVRQRRLRGPKS